MISTKMIQEGLLPSCVINLVMRIYTVMKIFVSITYYVLLPSATIILQMGLDITHCFLPTLYAVKDHNNYIKIIDFNQYSTNMCLPSQLKEIRIRK